MWFRNECSLTSRVPAHQHILPNVLVPSSERMTSLFLENEKKQIKKNSDFHLLFNTGSPFFSALSFHLEIFCSQKAKPFLYFWLSLIRIQYIYVLFKFFFFNLCLEQFLG